MSPSRPPCNRWIITSIAIKNYRLPADSKNVLYCMLLPFPIFIFSLFPCFNHVAFSFPLNPIRTSLTLPADCLFVPSPLTFCYVVCVHRLSPARGCAPTHPFTLPRCFPVRIPLTTLMRHRARLRWRRSLGS